MQTLSCRLIIRVKRQTAKQARAQQMHAGLNSSHEIYKRMNCHAHGAVRRALVNTSKAPTRLSPLPPHQKQTNKGHSYKEFIAHSKNIYRQAN